MKKRIKIRVPEYEISVGGILEIPMKTNALLVLAHGAGAGMEHAFMEGISRALAERGIATLRFNFIYMDEGKRRPDSPPKTKAVLRVALDRAHKEAAKLGVPVLSGGKSFGGRMFSLLAAEEGLQDSLGIIFFGFPLHAAGKPDVKRAGHLNDIQIPTLFLQGTRDTLATPGLIKKVTKGVPKATLSVVEGADHGFHMLKKSGISDDEVIDDLADRVSDWVADLQ